MAIWLQVFLWMGVVALHLGFAGVAGVLMRRAHLPGARPVDGNLALVHTTLLFLPSTVLVVNFPEWPFLTRFGLVLLGLAVVWIAAAQPNWTPRPMWHRSFGHRYFALVMALAGVWGLGGSTVLPSLPSTLLGTAACVAGAASFFSAPRS